MEAQSGERQDGYVLSGAANGEVETLPSEWEWTTLSRIGSTFLGGGTPSTKVDTYWGGEVPWTTSAQISGLYLTDGAKTITREGLVNSSSKVIPKGNLLIGTRVGVGKVAVNLMDVAISQDLTGVVVDKESACPEYVAYALMTDRVQKHFQTSKRGSTIKGIPREDLKRIKIPLPPLYEQRAIAHVLSTIQQAIEAADKVIVASRVLKQSILRHLFTYGPVDVACTSTVRLRETGVNFVPEHWREMPLSACAYVQTGAAKGRHFGSAKTVVAPYLRVANVQDGYLDLAEIKSIEIGASEYDRYRLQKGDVLLTEGGDFDKLGRGFIWDEQIANCIHQNHIFAVRTNREVLLPEFFAYLVQSDYGKSYFLTVAHRTTHLACINSAKLKSFPVILPSREEQRQIVLVLSAVDRKLVTDIKRRDTLQALFKSALQQLMTGTIRVGTEFTQAD
jgi:type I restriction enzyme S subunit